MTIGSPPEPGTARCPRSFWRVIPGLWLAGDDVPRGEEAFTEVVPSVGSPRLVPSQLVSRMALPPVRAVLDKRKSARKAQT